MLPFRNDKGRFISRVEAIERNWTKPHGHSGCGKGQYKSKECKSKSIAKAAGEGYDMSPAQEKYLDWLKRQGAAVERNPYE